MDFDLIKLLTAFAAVVGAVASAGSWRISHKTYKRNDVKVFPVIRRAQDGPFPLQNPRLEILIFEVYNQSSFPVVVNEVGIRVQKRFWDQVRFINLVNLPLTTVTETERQGIQSAIGDREFVYLPRTIPSHSAGILLVSYSRMRSSYHQLKNKDLPPEHQDFVGSQKLIRAFEEIQAFEDGSNCLRITPWAMTGSGKRFVGKKAVIKLGPLAEAI